MHFPSISCFISLVPSLFSFVNPLPNQIPLRVPSSTASHRVSHSNLHLFRFSFPNHNSFEETRKAFKSARELARLIEERGYEVWKVTKDGEIDFTFLPDEKLRLALQSDGVVNQGEDENKDAVGSFWIQGSQQAALFHELGISSWLEEKRLHPRVRILEHDLEKLINSSMPSKFRGYQSTSSLKPPISYNLTSPASLGRSSSIASPFNTTDFRIDSRISDPTSPHTIYHPYASLRSLLVQLSNDFPAFARLVNIGKGAEGERDILGVEVGDWEGRLDSLRKGPKSKEGGKGNDKGDNFYIGRTGGLRRKEEQEQEQEEELRSEDAEKESIKTSQSRMVIIGGQHAREWIAPSVSLYLLHSILLALTTPSLPNHEVIANLFSEIPSPLSSKSSSRSSSSKSQFFSITFIPLVNPDGYEYAWEVDRLWRKNRMNSNGDECVGIDLNRNWGANFVPPLRPSPCSDSFSGYQPFEAPELQAVRDYVLRGFDDEVQTIGWVDFHSFGQMLMYPYAYSCSSKPPDEENLFEAALGAVKALKGVHGRTFEVGSTCEVSYSSPGDSVDWAYSTHFTSSSPSSSPSSLSTSPGSTNRHNSQSEENESRATPKISQTKVNSRELVKPRIRYAYSAELRDVGTNGFLLPEQQIIPSGEESLEMLISLTKFMRLKEEGGRH